MRRDLILTQQRLKQNYVVSSLKSSIQELYGRHHVLIDFYEISMLKWEWIFYWPNVACVSELSILDSLLPLWFDLPFIGFCNNLHHSLTIRKPNILKVFGRTKTKGHKQWSHSRLRLKVIYGGGRLTLVLIDSII